MDQDFAGGKATHCGISRFPQGGGREGVAMLNDTTLTSSSTRYASRQGHRNRSHVGAEVPVTGHARHRTGWRQNLVRDRTDIPGSCVQAVTDVSRIS